MPTTQFSKCDHILDEYRLNASATGLHFYTNIFTIILNVVLSVPGMFFNALIVVSYLTNKRLRTSCTMLFVALATSDFMVTAIIQPIYIVKKFQEILGSDGCSLGVVLKIATYTGCGCSLAVMVILSVERFVTLAYPYRYWNIVNPFRLKLSVSLAWTILPLLTISHYFIPSIIHFYLAAAYLTFCIIIVVFIWVWIHRLIIRHKRQIFEQQNIQMKATKRQKVLSTAKTSYVLITALLICYFPSIVTNLYTLPNGSDFNSYFLVYPWLLSFLYGNSTLTPLLVFWRKKVFRDTSNTICYGLMCRLRRIRDIR
jgi:hypothetical protein